MGDYSQSVKFHYSRGNIEALRRIANDITIDEDDRDDARKFIDEIKKRQQEKDKQDDKSKEEIE